MNYLSCQSCSYDPGSINLSNTKPVTNICYWKLGTCEIITWHYIRRFTRLQVVVQVFDQKNQETEKGDTTDCWEDSARSGPTWTPNWWEFCL